MSQEKKQEKPDGLVEVACRKKGSDYEVVLRSREKGQVVEKTLRSTYNRGIAADGLSRALLESGL